MKVEIRGDMVFAVEKINISSDFEVEKVIPVMTKEVFQECYEKWIVELERNPEVVVNETCLNCELDCVEVVRCRDCKNYKEAKNEVNGFCKEWQTSTYTWEWCAGGERKDSGEDE